MSGIQITLFGAVLGLGLAGIAYLLVVPLLRLLPGRWLMPIRWPLVIGVGFLGILFTFYFIPYGLIIFNFIDRPFPGMHACGGPYVPNSRPCEIEVWNRWNDEINQDMERFQQWLRMPPSLRPSCAWVAQRLCGIITANPILTSWATYIGLLLAIFEGGLACAVMIDWIWRRAVLRRFSDALLPLVDT